MSGAPLRPAAVMASRREPPTSLDFFPTPPWATRALLRHVLAERMGVQLGFSSAWEPAAGEGHMAEVLRESFRVVHASDIFDYGRGYALGDFTDPGLLRVQCPFAPDWIITNPPYNDALAFALRALAEATDGVALLTRLAWLETETRWRDLFAPQPPTLVALFAERVPMHRGRWDPNGSTATAYTWVIWRKRYPRAATELMWIPYGCRETLTLPGDAERFGGEVAAGEMGGLFGILIVCILPSSSASENTNVPLPLISNPLPIPFTSPASSMRWKCSGALA